MEYSDIINTIFESIEYCDTQLSSLKNKYNTARKNKAFNISKWISKNFDSIMCCIACSLGLVQPATEEYIDRLPFDLSAKRHGAETLIRAIVILTCKEFDNNNYNWIRNTTDKTIISELAIQAALYDEFEVSVDDNLLLGYICELIYDFFYCFLQTLYLYEVQHCTSCALIIFNTLIRKVYYKKRVILPLRNHYKKILNSKELCSKACIGNLGTKILGKFCSMDLDRSRWASFLSSQMLFYCQDELNSPKPIEGLSSDQTKIIKQIFDFFKEERTYNMFIKMTKNVLTEYKSDEIIEVIIILLTHNQLVFYTNKTKQDFLHSLTSKNFTIELNTEDKNQIFSLVFQPASYNLLAKRKWYFNINEKTKKNMNENSIENLIIALWKCSAIKLFLNKDHEVNNSICENEAMCLQVISDMLSYFSQPKCASDYLYYYKTKYFYADPFFALFYICAAFLSVDLVFRCCNNEIDTVKYDWAQVIWKDEPLSDNCISEKIWSCLHKQRTFSFISAMLRELSNKSVNIPRLISAICKFSDLKLLEIKTNKRKKQNDVTEIYRFFLCLLFDSSDRFIE